MMNGKSGKQQPEGSRIPVMSPSPLRRSGSLRLNTCPPIQERSDSDHKSAGFRLNRQRSLQSLNTAGMTYAGEHDDDDLDSVKSYTSTGSVCSSASQCEHAHFARNGTTYSGRCKRYVVHCSPHSTATDDYLTPTQRTNRTIRHLRNLLKDAQEDIVEKEKEIARLTKEVVELRLLKVEEGDSQSAEPEQTTVTPGSPPTRSCGSPGDAVAGARSLSDSGHFEDLAGHSTPVHNSHTSGSGNNGRQRHNNTQQLEDEIRELKERHNERVDSLLQRITDVNDRYYALRPLYEDCKEKLREALKLNEELQSSNSQSQQLTIVHLQNSNRELQAKQEELLDKLNRFEQLNRELEAIKLSHDILTEENSALKDKEDELTNSLEHMKEQEFISTEALTRVNEELELLRKSHDKLAEENGSLKRREEELVNACVDRMRLETYEKDNQTDHFDHLLLSHTSTETQTELTSEEFEQNHYDSLDSLRPEEGGTNDKEDLRQSTGAVQPTTTNQLIENGQVQVVESSVIPDLLQKLQVTQEELEDIRDVEFVSADNLLSAREAVALWSLARQIKYRRLLEMRREAPKNDAEMTLQFLKSAFYYFFTDRENSQGHLAAIESILGFNDTEKSNIDKAYLYR